MACGGRGNLTRFNNQSPHIGVYQSVALNETRYSILLCEPKMPVNRMDVNLAPYLCWRMLLRRGRLHSTLQIGFTRYNACVLYTLTGEAQA